MKLDKKGIPSKVLNGKVRKYKSVYNIYRAILIQQVMVQVNKSFWVRAKGGTDDLGNKWKPLHPKTHAYKPLSPMERKTYKLGNRLNRGLLTPAQNKLWARIFARTLKRLGSETEENKKKAAEKAWAILKAQGAKTLIGMDRKTDINIRTGALVAATKPGTVANNRYYPPKNQIVKLTSRGIRIKLTIPYIKQVDEVRPVIPNDITPWIIQAHNIAIEEAKLVYERIKNTT